MEERRAVGTTSEEASTQASEQARHWRYSVFPFFVISDDISRVCRMSAVSFISSAIRPFGASFRGRLAPLLSDACVLLVFIAHHRRRSVSSHPPPCTLRPESCSYEFLHECKRRSRRLCELLPQSLSLYAADTSVGSFLARRFPFSSPSLSFVSLSLALFLSFSLLFLSLPPPFFLLALLTHVYVTTSRIAEIPHLFSFSGTAAAVAAVGSRGTGRITRTRETGEKNEGRRMGKLRAYFALAIDTKLIGDRRNEKESVSYTDSYARE